MKMQKDGIHLTLNHLLHSPKDYQNKDKQVDQKSGKI